MIERRMPRREEPRELTVDDFRHKLRIDPDNLNAALEDQANLYYQVADAYAQAVSERDAVKLQLEEKSAEVDNATRVAAIRKEEKLTEAAVQTAVKLHPEIKELQREFLKARSYTDSWGAMKEAIQQRSYMLRELVQLTLAQLHSLGVERGVQSARVGMADVNHARASEMRRQRREGTRG